MMGIMSQMFPFPVVVGSGVRMLNATGAVVEFMKRSRDWPPEEYLAMTFETEEGDIIYRQVVSVVGRTKGGIVEVTLLYELAYMGNKILWEKGEIPDGLHATL